MSTPKLDPARERHWICAKRLRERRLALGLTQREVVDRLGSCGTTNRSLSAMENGRGLDLGLLPELAEALDCTVTYLLGLASDPSAWAPDGCPSRPDPMTAPPARPPTGASGILGPYVPAGRRLRALPGGARMP